MSLIFTDYSDRRKREKRGPVKKQLKRKRGNFDETQATPEKRTATKLAIVMKNVTNMTEREITTLVNRLSTKSGFGHMNPELLMAMILLLQRTQYEKPGKKDFIASILDPILRQVLPDTVDYLSLSELVKNNLYASIFRYINWYFTVTEGTEEGAIEELSEEFSEEEDLEETGKSLKLEETLM